MNDGSLAVLLVLENAGMEGALGERCRTLLRSNVGDPASFLDSDEGRAIRAIVTSGAIPLEDWMWRLPELKLIACVGVGYDGIDVRAARERGIEVTAGRGVNDEDVADLAIGLIIALVRHIVPGDRYVRASRWDRLPALTMARSITQLRYGIVGLGAIGSAIARRLTGFGVEIAWWGPNAKPDVVWPRAESLRALAQDSDVLIVAAPSTPASRHMINADILAALSPAGYLVNISRGDLVDETALVAALRDKNIAGAALDVFEGEPDDGARWRDLENIVVTPHLGGWASRGMDEARRMCAANVHAVLAAEPPLSPVPAI